MNKLIKCLLIFAIITLLFTACGNKDGLSNIDQEQITAKPKSVQEIGKNLNKVTFESTILGKDMDFNIYLPTGYSNDKKYPVLYIVHGYSGNEDSWIPNLGMDKKAEELIKTGKIDPLIIISPDMENSFGINSNEKYRTLGGADRTTNMSEGMFEDYLYKELIPFVDANYSTDAVRESRYIGGLSMGGFIAIHLAFRHPDMFSKAGGHSPALFTDNFPRNLESFLYPSETIRKGRDPLYILKDKDLSSLSVYLDCGDEDSYRFYEGCEKLYHILQAKNVKSQYSLNSGKHDGDYWSSHCEDYLLFYAGKE